MSARTCFLWLIVATLGGVACAQPESQIRWAPDLISARQAAQQFKVPLLVHFTGEGCLPCRNLEKNVYTNSEVIKVMNRFFICVSVNCTRDPKTMREFGIESYPTDIFFTADGKKLEQTVCSQEPNSYLTTLERIAVMNRDHNIVISAQAAARPGTIAQQSTPPSGSQPTTQMQLPGLPPPGFASSANSNNTGFYMAAAPGQTQQQLQPSVSPNSAVQSGPLTASQQPQPITGSMLPAAHQVGAYSTSSSLAGQGPSPSTVIGSKAINANTSVPSTPLPSLPPIVSSSITNHPQIPTLTNQPVNPSESTVSTTIPGQLVSSSKPWNQTANAYSLTSNMVTTTNPYYPNPSLSALPSNPQAEQAMPAISTANVDSTDAAGPVSSIPTSAAPPSSAPDQGELLGSSTDQATAQRQTVAAIDGYCPVGLRSKQWLKGQPQFAVQHRGAVYWMSDAAALDQFIQRPDFYAPILMGYDPMVLLSQGQMVQGSTQYGLFEDRMGAIFFSSAESKAEFYREFSKNMTAIELILQRAAASPR